MPDLLRVKDWDAYYENNRTRNMKNTSWVPLPNKHDNEGYIGLVTHPNGAAHLGAWTAILQVASKCHPRGTLLRKDGSPHAPESLAMITRLPESVFAEAIPRLIAIGWLESIACQVPAVNPQDRAGFAQGTDGDVTLTAHPVDEEQNRKRIRIEGEAIAHAADSFAPDISESKQVVSKVTTALRTAFDNLSGAYPNCTGVDDAFRLWMEYCEAGVITEANVHEVDEGLRRWKDSATWAEENGRFIMSFLRWIHEKRWKDRPKVSAEAEGRARASKPGDGSDAYKEWRPAWKTTEGD